MVSQSAGSPEFFYHDHFEFYLPEGHSFPIHKYSLLRQRLVESGVATPSQIKPGPAATTEQLALAHTMDYIDRVDRGGLTEREIRRTGFPWSPELAVRSRYSVGSTIAACRSALRAGLGFNLGGGTHHACADHGQGYCVYNDVAVAAMVMRQEGLADRVLIVDCDVHQGNGTASILKDEPNIFTFSIHGEKNFPFRKEDSDLDIGLEDDTGDEVYLQILADALEYILARFTPDLILYIAGADPYREDRLGRFALSKGGLRERDELVFSQFLPQGVPLAAVSGGGYAKDVNDIVDIHFATLEAGIRMAAAQGSG
ncbi:MAG: histone deacetylase [Anaerolineales bacterium]|jgi:acetoin utilization deacetylase AcuC-like enzyme